jgi:hypothetical protein
MEYVSTFLTAHTVHSCGWFSCHHFASHGYRDYRNYRISVLALLLLPQQ